MNQSTVHNLVWFPIFLIGLSALCFGLLWTMYSKPWLIDQASSDIVLQTSLQNLLSIETNKLLPKYLIAIYRFFGLWLITTGLLTLSYVKITRLGTIKSRYGIHFIFFIVLCSMYYLVFIYFPTPTLAPALHFISLLLGVSIYFSFHIKE